MIRMELTDEEYALLEPDLPPERPKKAGRPWAPHRVILNGIFWDLRTGAPWRDVPERYGPWQTVYERFSRWRAWPWSRSTIFFHSPSRRQREKRSYTVCQGP